VNRLVVVALAALALAALVDGVKGGDGASFGPPERASGSRRGAGVDPARLRGPDVPVPGALPGTLVAATGEDCRLRTVTFSSASVGDEGAPTACRLWVSPAGNVAAVATARSNDLVPREIGLVRLAGGEGPEPLGIARGAPTWAPDGSRLAWCDSEQSSVVRELAGGRERRVEGCSPRFAPDGALYTLVEGGLLRDGVAVLDAGNLGQAFAEQVDSGTIEIVGYDVGPQGLLAVSAVRRTEKTREAVLALLHGNRLEASVRLPETSLRTGAGGLLRFSPDGTKLAAAPPGGAGSLSVVDLRLGTLVLAGVLQQGFAWSPDGAWLALAIREQVQIVDAISAKRIYTLPLDASALDWAGGS
jgi:hypothetical protein